jgi:DNA polymerase
MEAGMTENKEANINKSIIYPRDKDTLPETWTKFISACEACTLCPLHESRTNVVVFKGAVDAPLMIIGEGPGAEEDAQGLPFVGASGKLLDLLLTAYGLGSETYHICNIVKCRPPQNRVPTPEEAKICKKLLAAQFSLVKPMVIILLGATAYKYFTNSQDAITKIRGNWIEKNGYFIMPTFHPAYILRNNTQRIHLWHDIGLVRKKLEELALIEPMTDQPEMPVKRS